MVTKNKSIKEKVASLPKDPGVYLMKDQTGNIIYVGKAKNLKNRVSSYFVNTQKPLKVMQMVNKVFSFDYIVTKTEFDALNLESNLIKRHQPFYNILLKDNKNHAFLKIDTKQKFPKLEIVRKIKRDGAKYFGPYFSGVSVRDLVKIISNAFMLRDLESNSGNDKPYERQSLMYLLGKGNKNFVKTYNNEIYMQDVQEVIDFLNGNLQTAKETLENKMLLNANMQNFEQAIEHRESLNLLEKLNKRTITELNVFVNLDIIFNYYVEEFSVVSIGVVRAGKFLGINNHFLKDAELSGEELLSDFIMQYYKSHSSVPQEILVNVQIEQVVQDWLNQEAQRKVLVHTPQRGIKKELLNMVQVNSKEYFEKNLEKEKLKQLKTTGAINILKQDLKLKELPYRIEGYDISNMQGTYIVASMVVFINGEPQPSHYRKFKIKSVVGKNNDFDSMKEVILRRISNLKTDDVSFSHMPNLILIDGGKGQLSSACEILENAGISVDIVSLAKKQEEVFVPNQSQSVVLSLDNFGLKLLQSVRNEAHRFAITFHRSLRSKGILTSMLLEIEGVGEKTAKQINMNFKNINNLKTATIEEIVKIGKVSNKVAQNIHNHFQNN